MHLIYFIIMCSSNIWLSLLSISPLCVNFYLRVHGMGAKRVDMVDSSKTMSVTISF
jgi:hypothetical protein